jgi:methylmalonyl-CoA/ethylmalonyl-CoA epimerase
MYKRINHIGVAVKNLEESMRFYRDQLGFEFKGIDEVKEQKVKVAMFKIGETNIELVQATSEDSPIAKYLEKNKEGIHHICYEVDDIVKTIEELKAKGVKLINDEPKNGAHNTKVAFIHPKSSGGVLTELCELPK